MATKRSDPEAYEVVLEEAKRALQHQAGAIDELRRRTGILLGAASIAISFLGGIALDDGSIGSWGIAGVGTFAAVGVACLVILWPFSWRFVSSAEVLIDDWVEADPPVTVSELRRELARFMHTNLLSNQTKLNRLWNGYQGAIVLLFASVGCWLAELVNLRIEVG